MVKALAHVCISSTDLALTERFYCSGLGLHKVFDFVRGGEVVGFYLEVSPQSFIEIFYQEEVESSGASPIRHLCLEVSDIDKMTATIESQGYDVTEKKLGADQSWQAWVTDPSGVRIEFHQYTEKSSQVTGNDCLLDS